MLSTADDEAGVVSGAFVVSGTAADVSGTADVSGFTLSVTEGSALTLSELSVAEDVLL